ncbi:MAG: radical SAM protein [Candidatus Methanomethylicota archaeon]|uniref:Radical SAM protein n=1 Tax=Thermoproteota archaeon TaxID=2056631 RepID=A0A497EMK5_9CREN|nr:MAG: radical SAM protein [Candidatus Verstraetearchaeota archaeon]RLE51448.1 MAG: radical SAM protein [Candidatus Verstraetearchaeota archaeon]
MERSLVKVEVNGVAYEVNRKMTVKEFLESIGYEFSDAPSHDKPAALCCTGGCYACSLMISGQVKPACITMLEDGMKIDTDYSKVKPLRIVHGPQPHTVGGKATPWWYKRAGRYIEVAIWVAGCNLRCPQCQNFDVTYDRWSKPITPEEAALKVSKARRIYGVDRMAISGGEPTLNRKWLIQFFKKLKELNPDDKARLHLDSNGTLLTEDYIDELVEVGVTDIGVEPKGLYVKTFMEITDIRNESLAKRYLETSWRAIEYICERHIDKVFLGVGLPYNSAFITLDEVREFGEKLASINKSVQLCVLDYFPAYKRLDLVRPSPFEMLKVKRVLESTGLKNVIVQTSIGHIGP